MGEKLNQVDMLRHALDSLRAVECHDESSDTTVATLHIQFAIAVELRRIATALEALQGNVATVINDDFCDAVHVRVTS